MSLKLSHSKGPNPLLWAGYQAACGKITVNGIPNHLNGCVMFTEYTKFTNYPQAALIQSGRLWVGDPCATH